jgi:hypothetical protein
MSTLVTEDKPVVDTPAKSTTTTTSRLNINLPAAMAKELKRLAEEEGLTVTEIVRRAIAAERFLRENNDAGNEIYVRVKGEEALTRIILFR